MVVQLDGAKREGDKKTWIFDPESKTFLLSRLCMERHFLMDEKNVNLFIHVA